MKQVLKVIIVVFVIDTIKCHVTSSTKSDSTTILPENQPNNVSEIKISEKKTQIPKTVSVNETRIYLDNVLFTLKNQNWTEEELPCLNKTLRLLHDLQNFTLWAVWDWDSIASQPQGLLYGSRYHLGNYDECMNAPWYKKEPDLRTQYCLADIELERTDKSVKKRISDPFDPYQSALNVLEYQSDFLRPYNKLTWGVCAPAVCLPRSVERLTRVLLIHSHLGTAGLRAHISIKEKCQKVNETMEYDGLFYGFMGMAVILCSVTLICTIIRHQTENCDKNKLGNRIIAAFDMKVNAKNLLKVSDESLDVLYGIKFLTMCIIVSAHQFGIFNGGPVSNGFKVDEETTTIAGMIMLHEDVVVDSYFALSGLLTAMFLIKTKRLPNIFLLFLRRYVRLIVAYAIVIFYICAIFPYTGSGPLWYRAIAGDTEQCRKNWWISLLMLSNYIDSENICLVISWYIPCDFHFFVITVLLYVLYKKQPSIGKLFFIIIAIASIVTPGVINYLYNLPAIQLFTYDFISNPRGPLQFHMTYIKSHTRYAAYLIGFLAGYLHIYCSSSNNYSKIPRQWSILGAYFSILIMGVVMFTGPLFLWRSYDVLESAIYAAINRPAWAASLMLFVMCCSLGHVPILKSFLSWYPWVPLSRLSYGLYLIHTVFISRNVYVTRNPQHHDYMNIITSTLGIICEGCIFALITWLVAEAPINNLLVICLTPRPKSSGETETNQEVQRPTSSANYTNNGYLQENLQPSVQIISSKI
ncbi:unnamed protein product, partial [Brenthis ino]